MSLEVAFRKLSLRPSSICRQCRRTLVSSAAHRQQQSTAGAFADLLQRNRTTESTPTPTNPPTSTSTATPTPTTTSPSPKETPNDLATTTLRTLAASRARRQRAQEAENSTTTSTSGPKFERGDFERQIGRRWRAGDVYAPHDLTGVEQAKWKKLRRGKKRVGGRGAGDAVDRLGFDARGVYKNFSIMSEYMSDMGRIKHSNETGLRPVNQRRMAKAIRRAIGVGLMPGVHRHPEILRMEMNPRR